jgi:sec-independent protein translocase protein TatC
MPERDRIEAEPPVRPMTFLDHFEELRKRLFYSLIALAVGAVAAFFFVRRVIDLLTRSVPNLVFLAPSEAFVVQLKVALVVGAFVASPVIFYQFWRFVRPALRPKEAKYIVSAVFFSTLFFAGGVAFAYLVMVPFAMKFLLSYETEKLHAMLSIKNYVGTVGAFLLAAGLVFQLPVAVFFLTKFGIVKPRMLMKNQRIAIVIIFVVAAILSPPDVFSQIMMAIPLLILYELSIVGSYIAAGRKKPV